VTTLRTPRTLPKPTLPEQAADEHGRRSPANDSEGSESENCGYDGVDSLTWYDHFAELGRSLLKTRVQG
jgi:hypothetical protein